MPTILVAATAELRLESARGQSRATNSAGWDFGGADLHMSCAVMLRSLLRRAVTPRTSVRILLVTRADINSSGPGAFEADATSLQAGSYQCAPALPAL